MFHNKTFWVNHFLSPFKNNKTNCFNYLFSFSLLFIIIGFEKLLSFFVNNNCYYFLGKTNIIFKLMHDYESTVGNILFFFGSEMAAHKNYHGDQLSETTFFFF